MRLYHTFFTLAFALPSLQAPHHQDPNVTHSTPLPRVGVSSFGPASGTVNFNFRGTPCVVPFDFSGNDVPVSIDLPALIMFSNH